MKKIIIIGATSTIANACAIIWAQEKAKIFLVGRNATKLQQINQDLEIRGASVKSYITDLNNFDDHPKIISDALTFFEDKIDIVLVAHGTLPNQQLCQEDPKTALQEFSNNCLSVISILTPLINIIEKQNHGKIAVISSVAADRGRQSNYLYGSAKSAVTTFCSGARARLSKAGAHLITIKPGFVDTAMTADLGLPKILVASPQKVASDICKAIEKGSNSIYTPKFWWLIMLIIKSIPESIFKKLKL
jgi:decaprenylphospho-beta-D-erythro-pentofuranosid-2-ulose 2-reductase